MVVHEWVSGKVRGGGKLPSRSSIVFVCPSVSQDFYEAQSNFRALHIKSDNKNGRFMADGLCYAHPRFYGTPSYLIRFLFPLSLVFFEAMNLGSYEIPRPKKNSRSCEDVVGPS